MKTVTLCRYGTLLGFFATLLCILLWHTLWSPPSGIPVALILIVLLTPLLFPLRGLLHGKAYTHAWSSFMALFYFALGIGDAWSDPTTSLYGILLTTTSTLWFIAAITYVRALKKNA